MDNSGIARARLNGWLILDKPLGLSSSQAVGAVKRILHPFLPRSRKTWPKIGHGGTLDPLATGVLPIALGEATKLTGRMLDADKGYRFALIFGEATTSEDREGEVSARSDVRPDVAGLREVLARFTGPIRQTPPAYSALKVDGQRAYARARAGEVVVLPARNVTIHGLDLGEVACDQAGVQCAFIRVHCSKGTYVRALARDIALACGTVGHVGRLRRTRSGPFSEAQAISLDNWAQLVHSRGPEQAILPLRAGLDDIPALPVSPDQATLLRQGQLLTGVPVPPGRYLATCPSGKDGDMIAVALVEADADADGASRVRVTRGFNL